ncbi:hypothetical protein D6D85_12635 [Candidatus Methanodesulfokora washburnensis]|uniref:Uncharacterized protein n=2 Tax=Candidatus Methanodesulfokora washburnensis TaxID=2478471 RepID=A0A429GG57_9CREN|nr:hypothetical protein D6D85_12635 [Candidatus Methanodesulfokores washburnensis]
MSRMDLKEEEILREFVKRGILKGTFFMDVGIGTDDYWGVIDAVFVENLEPEAEPRIMKSKWWRKLQDDIKRRTKRILVIEVKETLNYEALGQIMVYRYLFPKVWGFPTVDSAILCKKSIKTLEEICRANDVLVFRI